MVDKALIMRKLVELEECLSQMREYSSITINKYSEDWKTQRIVERSTTPQKTCLSAFELSKSSLYGTNTFYTDQGVKIFFAIQFFYVN